MTCKRCRRPTRVTVTISSPGRTDRQRQCPCGITFFTVERMDRKSVRPSEGVARLTVTPAMRQHVFERDGFQCVYCGDADRLVVDHFISFAAPIDEGKTIEQETEYRNSVENMVCACWSCNASKGDRSDWVLGKKGPVLLQGTDEKGEEIDSCSDDLEEESDLNPGSPENPNRARVRGKAKQYSEEFEVVWRAYQRRQEKVRAYEAWKVASRVEGEEVLRDRILYALKWQAPIFAQDGWKYAPYLERYIKRAKWEDEPPPAAVNNGAIRQQPSRYCMFHRAYRTNGKLPREGAQVGCPECKHVMASQGKRTSEPTPIGAVWTGELPSPEQFAEIKAARKKTYGG